MLRPRSSSEPVRLPPEIAAQGVRLTSLDETGSTNADALAAWRAGDAGPHWFVARRQRAGRGRQGRIWQSPPGNLHASLLISGVAPRAAAQLGFVAGLALHEAVADVARLAPPRLQIKWPNDLLLDGAKLAGILLEAETAGGVTGVVIGLGVNVAAAPEGLPYPATCLAASNPGVEGEAVFAALASALGRRLAEWSRPSEAGSFEEVRRLWLARAAGLGQTIRVRLASGDRLGRFEGLDAVGRLILAGEAGREVIDAGDVFLPGAAQTCVAQACRTPQMAAV